MEKLCIGGNTLYGGIGDILYFMHKDPILQRIGNQEKQQYKPDLSVWNNRTQKVLDLFDPTHFSSMSYNASDHDPMLRVRTILDVPVPIKDKPPRPYPVPLGNFQKPKGPYFVCHLEVMEKDNEIELLSSFWKLLGALSRNIPVYLIGVGTMELPLPPNFIDLRGKTGLREAYHLTLAADRYLGCTSVWYLLSVLVQKPGWSFNTNHKLLFGKLNRLYPELDLINSNIASMDLEYE